MAKAKEEKLNVRTCPGCKTKIESKNKSQICTVCGQIATLETKPAAAPAEDTENRSADKGGRVF